MSTPTWILYKCWEAAVTLLKFFGCLDDNLEQPLLRRLSSHLSSSLHSSRRTSIHQEIHNLNSSTGTQTLQQPKNELCDDIGNVNLFNCEGANYDHELSLLEPGVFLDHIVQSPIQLSPTFKFASLLMPPTNNITDFSTEILLEIFRYLAVVGSGDEETASPLVLEPLRRVCRRWRVIVDTHCGRFLTATPGFLVQIREEEPPTWSRQFDAWCRINETGSALNIVAFYLCNRFASSWYVLDVEHARIFTRALMKCKTARIVVDLTETELRKNLSTRTTLPEIPLRDFSWTSEHMGIRHTLPEVYQFPWLTLLQDLPWQQLTRVDLDCPLSLWDAHHILAHGVNLTDARLATLKLVDDPDLPTLHTASTPLLRSLTMHSRIDLHALFSNLKLPTLTHFSLSAVHPRSFLTLIFHHPGPISDLPLNVPWEQIEELEIHYKSGHKYDIGPILSACRRLRRLALAGDLEIQVVTNFLRYLDDLTLDAGIMWHQPSGSLKETTIKNLIRRPTPLEQQQYSSDHRAFRH